MTQKVYFEDLFIKFSTFVFNHASLVDYKDISAVTNFYNLLIDSKLLTKSQGDFMIRLMKKYLLLAKSNGFDYRLELTSAEWRNEFRILDLSKKVFVELDSQKGSMICLKFPYAFKKIYETEFLNSIRGFRFNLWDHDKKINRIPASKVNIVYLYDFLKSNDFEIDDTFVDLTMHAEEIWQQNDNIFPHAVIEHDRVVLKNAEDDALTYWNEHKKDLILHDLLLAKSMAFVYRSSNPVYGMIEKMCSSENTDFWCSSLDKFFYIYKETGESIAIILDRSDDIIQWLETFVTSADNNNVNRSDIKVCFRDDKSANSKLNDWIKNNGVGGKIEDGKIFIFRHKPAKWLFVEKKDIKITATNSLFPMTNPMTQHWLDSRPCLLYLGNIKPSQIKEREIVKL